MLTVFLFKEIILKALYHQFTEGIPIIFVERFEDFANKIGYKLDELDQSDLNGSENYCRLIGFNKSPLKFIVFEEQMMRTLFGGKNQAVIDSTLALYVGQKKFPNNEYRAINHAIKLAVKEERKGAYNILNKLHSEKFKKESNIQLQEAVTDAGGGIGQGTPSPKPLKPSRPSRGTNKPRARAKPRNKAKGGFSPADKAKKMGFTSAGYGKWKDRSGKVVAQTVGDKLQMVAGDDVQGKPKKVKRVSKDSPEAKQALAKARAQGKEPGGEEPMEPEKPQVQKPQQQAPQVEPQLSPEEQTQAVLNKPYSGEKNKEPDQKRAENVRRSKTFRKDVGVTDQEFARANQDLWVNPNKKFKFGANVFKHSKAAKQSLQVLERMINTRPAHKSSKVSHFTDSAGAGEIRSQAGELAMLALASIDDDKAAEALADGMLNYIRENSNYRSGKPETDPNIIDDTTLTLSWVKAALQNRRAFKQRLDSKYGKGQWKMVAGGWDTKEEFEAMTGLKYEDNKGFSTDAYFTVQGPDGNIHLEEVSLKKSTGVNFLNSGTGKFQDWDPNLPEEISQKAFTQGANTRLREVYDETSRKKLEAYIKKNPNNPDVQSFIRTMEKKKTSLEKAILSKGGRGNNKVLLQGQALLAKAGDKKAKEFLKVHKAHSDKYVRDSIEAIGKNKELQAGMMSEIRSEFPLKAVADSEETMAIGPYSLDRATMKNIFGSADYDKIKENLTAEQGPPPFLGYRAEGEEIIPIAKIDIRENGVGYGSTMKFDMKLHPGFAKKLKSSHEEVYGGAEPPRADTRKDKK
jgi:hypothetical protein